MQVVKTQIVQVLQDPYLQLATLLLPKGLLDFFELKQVLQKESGLEIYLEEKNVIPNEYQNQKLESKGLLPPVSIQDFPIRGQKVALCIRRRRWTVLSTGEIVTRDWDIVHKGARMTTKFGLFLKGLFG